MADQPQNKPMTAAQHYKHLYDRLDAYLSGGEFLASVLDAAPTWATKDDGGLAFAKAVKAGVLSAVQSNRQLLTDCDGKSLIESIIRIIRKGLTVGDNISWLVPYKDKETGARIVQDQLGYMGLYQLAIRFGMVKDARTQPVFANDTLHINLGTPVTVDHSPPRGPRGAFEGVYALITLPNGSQDIEWMDKATVDAIRAEAPGKNSPAWVKWPTEMARAKVFKRLLKRAPKPINYDPALLRDMDDAIEGEAEEVHVGRQALSAPSEQPINKLDAFVTEQRQKVPVEDLDDDITGSQGWADHDAETGEIKQANAPRQEPKDEQEPTLGLDDTPRGDRPSTGSTSPSTGKAKDEVALILPGRKAVEYHPRNVASTIVQREADGRDTKWLAAVVANNWWIAGSPLEKVLDGLRKALVEGEHD